MAPPRRQVAERAFPLLGRARGPAAVKVGAGADPSPGWGCAGGVGAELPPTISRQHPIPAFPLLLGRWQTRADPRPHPLQSCGWLRGTDSVFGARPPSRGLPVACLCLPRSSPGACVCRKPRPDVISF